MNAFLAARRVADYRAAGSSLKFCLIARGEADLYPRFGTTMEWDTAAGHAVLAGGRRPCNDAGRFAFDLWETGLPQSAFSGAGT
jgi:3'(2'), 5'-bisphosphate nucleotidase